MWHLYHQAQSWNQRASELLELDLPWFEAYCFDEAVEYCGLTISNMLSAIDEKDPKLAERKRTQLMGRLLGSAGVGSGQSGQYADPMVTFFPKD